ncbi:MAG TPA: hypothetical protein VFN56_01330 [Candidatus Saccharimonadales bacterium]|nr:hypothetical protein [Candidatus Saccharimonadales bacterium]
MDFSNRVSQSQPTPSSGSQFGESVSNRAKTKPSKDSRWTSWAAYALLVIAVLLIAAAVLDLGLGGAKAEASYVDKNKLQAVFLNTGQVYFGNVKTLNNNYVVLTNIYYLQTSNNGSTSTASNSNQNVSLVKLGCELHAPYDQMVINRNQVTFWENLQDSGQVAKAVATFQKDNPNGQKCSDQSQAGNSSSNGVQGSQTPAAAPTTTPTAPTTTTTKP